MYTSDTLERDVEVTGPLEVNLFASSTARDTDFTAKLVDVHPDGYARNLQDGVIRARYRESSTDPHPNHSWAGVRIPDLTYGPPATCSRRGTKSG